MSSEGTFDEDEARRLINTALGSEDRFGEVMDRATASVLAFCEAAKAYAADDLLKSAQVMESFVRHAKNPHTGVHDLCASGAAIVAAMFAGRTRTCTAPGCKCGEVMQARIEPPDAEDGWTVAAVACINAAADKDPETIEHNLAVIYDVAGTPGLQRVVTSMVHAHMKVSEMVAELD